jgi:hypothetical protein
VLVSSQRFRRSESQNHMPPISAQVVAAPIHGTGCRWLNSLVFPRIPDSLSGFASLGECNVANDGVCQKTSIWRALGSRLRSKTVQFRPARRELPHNFPLGRQSRIY